MRLGNWDERFALERFGDHLGLMGKDQSAGEGVDGDERNSPGMHKRRLRNTAPVAPKPESHIGARRLKPQPVVCKMLGHDYQPPGRKDVNYSGEMSGCIKDSQDKDI